MPLSIASAFSKRILPRILREESIYSSLGFL